MRPRSRTAPPIARVAERQKGLITRAELLELGLTPAAVQRRVRSGLLLPEFPGVYRVGHRAPDIETRYLAATKACGGGAALCDLAAGWLLGLVKRAAPPPSVVCPADRRVAGVRTRRCRSLDPRDVTTVRGIPTTTVQRTLVDLAPLIDEAGLARACHEAAVRYRTTPAQIGEVLGRRPNAPGAAALRRVLMGDVNLTLSRLEDRFLELLQERGWPLPQTNRPAGAYYVDCRWPDLKLTIELDSYRYHSSRHAWEADRLREREARARGDDFRRLTWGDVFERQAATLGELEVVFA